MHFGVVGQQDRNFAHCFHLDGRVIQDAGGQRFDIAEHIPARIGNAEIGGQSGGCGGRAHLREAPFASLS